MDEFLLKTLSKTVDVEVSESLTSKISVTRTRSSKGYCCIKLCVDNQFIEFHTDNLGASYEQVAREANQLLDEVTNNPCLLPKANTKD